MKEAGFSRAILGDPATPVTFITKSTSFNNSSQLQVFSNQFSYV